MKLFQLYGFQRSAVVCDVASANLTALKTATGSLGAYGAGSNTSEKRYTIPSPKFENPFNPPQVVHWIICPSHQVCLLPALTFFYIVTFYFGTAVEKQD